MKYNLDGIIVVEGKSDVSYLSSFINGLFFVTNGFDINENKISFLKAVFKVNKIIILTDSDAAGEVIRNRISSQIESSFVIKISGKSRKNYQKNGVAESNMSELINLLKPFFVNESTKLNNYHLSSYISLSNHPTQFKDMLIKKYRLIDGSIKSLENQLNMLKISPNEIKTFFEEK